MNDFYVLKTGKNQNDYIIERIEPYVDFYMDVYGVDCLTMSYTEFLNLKNNCTNFFKTLTEREANVLTLNYGFLGNKYSTKEIGNAFHVTPTRIKQIKENALYRAKRTRIGGYCRKEYTPITCYENVESRIIDYRQILIDELQVWLFDRKKSKHFLHRVLSKNNVSLQFALEEINGIKVVKIEDMDLSVRSYNCLKRAGILDLVDLLSLDEEELSNIRNLGSKSLQEIKDKIKVYVKDRDKIDVSKLDKKYAIIEFRKDCILKECKIPNVSKDIIAKLAYEMLINECTAWKPLIDYDLSTGLMNLLLIRGSLFIENILDEEDRIIDELKFLGYEDFAFEFTRFISKFKEHIQSNANNYISFMRINEETKTRFMSDRIPVSKVISDLYLKKINDETYRHLLSNLFLNPNITLQTSERKEYIDLFEQFITYDISDLTSNKKEEQELYDEDFEDFCEDELYLEDEEIYLED